MDSRRLLVICAAIVMLGMLALPASAAAEVHGQNLGLGQVDNLKNQVGSLNWGGYVAANSFTAPTATVTSVSASWVVQSAAKTSTATYSAQWTGIGGFFSSDSSLIQLGTESDYYRNAPHYSAWIEMLPNSEQVISLPVQPGDRIVASIAHGTTAGTWAMTMTDLTAKGSPSYSTTVTYTSSELSGEYIEERPEICSAFTCSLTTLASFGTAYFGGDNTGQTGTDSLTVGGTSNVIGKFPWESVTMYVESYNSKTKTYTYTPIATPSALSSDGTSFTMTYLATSVGSVGSGFGGPAGHPERWSTGGNPVTDAPGPLDHRVH